jgi:hypothetical protein
MMIFMHWFLSKNSHARAWGRSTDEEGWMGESTRIRARDLLQAGALLLWGIAAVAVVVGQFLQIPGFVWPLLLALAAAMVELWRRCRLPVAVSVLGKLTPNYVRAAIGAVALAFVMPALISSDVWEHTRWLIWIDGLLLLGGLSAVPMAHAVLFIADRLAQRQ